jgi:hypothetical protein
MHQTIKRNTLRSLVASLALPSPLREIDPALLREVDPLVEIG